MNVHEKGNAYRYEKVYTNDKAETYVQINY
jgi:hypothetical protein